MDPVMHLDAAQSAPDCAHLAGAMTTATGLAILGGCQLVSPPAPKLPKARRIGYLYAGTRTSLQPLSDVFVDRLRQLGWAEGENLSIEWCFAEGDTQKAP
jgi:hypothetical protein